MRATQNDQTSTLKGVTWLRHASRVKGPPRHLSPEQIGALRSALRDFDAERARSTPGWNQTKLGDALGVSQQVAGRYLSTVATGISYPTAIRIVELVAPTLTMDEFFASKGVGRPAAPNPERGNRSLATNLARSIGVAELAVQTVLERYRDSTFDSKPTKWWVGKFIDEDKDLAPPPVEPPPQRRTKVARKEPVVTEEAAPSVRRRKVG